MKRKILIFSFCILITLFTSSFFFPKTKKVIVTYDDILNEPTKHIDPTKPMIALTFDDGPFLPYTEMILDTLKENNAYATFFILGDHIEDAPHLLERMILEGHEIGNHTYSHYQLTHLNEDRVKEEINKTQEEIFSVIHRYPHFLRPPYGEYNETVMNYLGEMRIVKWNVDSEDWRSKNTKIVVDKVLHDVKDKAIILMHDQYLTTALAVSILVPRLIEEGYQLVSVSDLYSFE